jgi:hypothetical protein
MAVHLVVVLGHFWRAKLGILLRSAGTGTLYLGMG